MTYVVGLTGGIGSGKTAASDWFAAQGIQVVDADVVARDVVAPTQPALAQIHAHFGDWVLQADGCLNRSALREYIFNHPEARQALEAITHPVIRRSIEQQLAAASSAYAILVSPLLFESGQHQLTQRNVLIDVSPSLQIARASARDQQSVVQIEKIIAAQMPRALKQQRADDIVRNDGSLQQLYAQLQQLHQYYLKQAAQY